jgi:hypothetical protein
VAFTGTTTDDSMPQDQESGGPARNWPFGPGRAELAVVGAVFLVAAAALEILALFPSQGQGIGFGSLSHSDSQVAAQIILAVGFAVTGSLCGFPSRRLSLAGAVIAAGIVACEVGLVLADFGTVVASTSAGLGLWLQAISLIVAAFGIVCAFVAHPGASWRGAVSPGDSVNRSVAWMTLIASAALGVALIPAWDRLDFDYVSFDTHRIILSGNAFSSSNPGLVQFGTALTAAAFVLVPLVGVLWRPARVGVLVTVGVVLVVASQAVMAVLDLVAINIDQYMSSTEIYDAGGVILRPSLTWWFDLEVIAALALLVLVVARWWTPVGGSLYDSYPVGPLPQPAPSPWIQGSTAPAPGTIGYGAPVPPPPRWAPGTVPLGPPPSAIPGLTSGPDDHVGQGVHGRPDFAVGGGQGGQSEADHVGMPEVDDDAALGQAGGDTGGTGSSDGDVPSPDGGLPG